jgi:hypothetical protein
MLQPGSSILDCDAGGASGEGPFIGVTVNVRLVPGM